MPMSRFGIRPQGQCPGRHGTSHQAAADAAPEGYRWRLDGRRWFHESCRLHTRIGRTCMVATRNLLAVALVISLLPWVVAAQGIDNYSGVTEARLLQPEPHNWLMYRRTYDGWGYSPLDQINTTNVKKLVPVWTLSSGLVEGHESPPIVNNGVMFITTPQSQVVALNAKTGDILWR